MFELKPLSRSAVDAALSKAERYRLLNEPAEAESICLDILAVDPDNQQATITLVLSLSQQFQDEPAAGSRAAEVAGRLRDDYDRAYYSGIVAERRAKAHLRRGGTPAQGIYEWLTEALECFERAETLRSAGNDDAILRWNACVRMLQQHPHLHPVANTERESPLFLE
jgi:hypothetical protein